MGFTQAINSVLRDNYSNFKGRASRSEYWWFQLFNILVLAVIGGIGGAIIGITGGEATDNIGVIALGIAGVIYLLAMLVPLIALQVRRFHDRNMSGWWYLGLFLAGFIPLVGSVTGITITVISILKGTDGPNRFGPDPLRPNVTADIFA